MPQIFFELERLKEHSVQKRVRPFFKVDGNSKKRYEKVLSDKGLLIPERSQKRVGPLEHLPILKGKRFNWGLRVELEKGFFPKNPNIENFLLKEIEGK